MDLVIESKHKKREEDGILRGFRHPMSAHIYK